MPEKVTAGSQPPSHARKRKQSPASQLTTDAAPSFSQGYQQSTIPELFAASSNAQAHLKPSQHCHKVKRSKTSESELSGSSDPVEKQAESSMKMFSPPNVIDLTDSPPRRLSEPSRTLSIGTASGNSIPPKIITPVRPPAFQPHAGARQLVVKNLKKRTKVDPEAYFEQTWRSLNDALTATFNRQRISTSLEELYRGTENICRSDKSPQLFERLRGRLDDYIKGPLKAGILEQAARSDHETVRAIEGAWSQLGQQLDMIRSIFLYLDRSYLLPSPGLKSIEATGLELFRTHVARDPTLEPKFMKGTFALFEYDRENQGESINIGLLLSCIRMISSLGLYNTVFEPKFIIVSREYFTRVANELSSTQDLAGYIKQTAGHIERENARCERFHLDISTKRELVAVMEDEFLQKQIAILTNDKDVGNLLFKRDIGSLATLYNLLNRIGAAGTYMKSAWEKYIAAQGSSIVTDEEREVEMVPRLLEFKNSLDYVWKGPFTCDDGLGYTLREAFANFLNEHRPGQASSNNSKPAEMIAKYVDLLLKMGTKGLPGNVAGAVDTEMPGDDDAQLAEQLEKVLDLFRFIQGKDVFEAFYKKDLARRLLMGKSASADAERSMLTKLKTECGAGFTHNLEGMFKDIELSKEAVASFKSSRAGQDKSRGVDLFVNILSQSAWPSYPEIPVSLPRDLAEYLDAFRDFYLAKHNGRKLMWRHSLSHCILKASFPKGKKELVLSAFQAVVLLLFNDASSNSPLSYSDLKTASGLSDPELNRTLQSLSCGKYRVLIKTPKGREVAPTDKFTVSLGFSDVKFRIKINQIQLKETKEENKETYDRVAQDRQYETQAAIIRIMKSRKNIRHSELVAMVIEQTKNRGVLDVADIKRNIERLIDKDYMDRAEGDTYVYVA